MNPRPLTAYEARVFEFMASREYTRCHVIALAQATTDAEREDVIQRAVERYEDWLTD